MKEMKTTYLGLQEFDIITEEDKKFWRAKEVRVERLIFQTLVGGCRLIRQGQPYKGLTYCVPISI